MFCTSVSGHRYICSKFIIAPKIRDRGGKERKSFVLD